MKRLRWFLVWMVALGCAFAGGIYLTTWLWPGGGNRSKGRVPATAVHSLGRLQPSGGLIQIVATPGDRVEKVHIKLGDTVKPDQPLVTLASHQAAELEEKLAQSRLDEASQQRIAVEAARKAKLAEIDAQLVELAVTRQSEEETQAVKIGVLVKQQNAARQQRDRLARLEGSRVRVSAQEREQQELLVAQAEGELQATKLALKRSLQVFDQKIRSAQAARDAAEAEAALNLQRIPLASLKVARDLARERRKARALVAGVKSTVLQVEAQPGMVTDPRPLVQLGAGKGLSVVAEVYETDVATLLGWLEKGPIPVTVTSSALPTPLTGTLRDRNAISRIIGRNTLFSPSPRADLDRRVIEVRVELDTRNVPAAMNLVGLDVEARFEPGKRE